MQLLTMEVLKLNQVVGDGMRQKRLPGMTGQGSLTLLVGQMFHISHMTHLGQITALEANTKQIYHGLGKLGFNLNTEQR